MSPRTRRSEIYFSSAIAHELYLSAAARRVPQNNTLALLFVLCVSARDVAI
ncbi:hypothetical protein H634G_11557 [Metarhizium anisopliae BRIP 53293]|uniref:Uncharacterized protein n=1 Tax=Metarhizium anisopliae BRIP 53293 TaxID=1291518 RepID=A0A0D9NHA1_METAN|nr:hypothetical protein H634G_11557 [Metarhizium anisopliae BRIP 53293]